MIAKVNGVSAANVAELNSVAAAAIEKVNGVDVASNTDLVFLIDTENPGTTASDTFRLPFVGSYTEIEWGDGNFEGSGSGSVDHTYTIAGIYTVTITATTGAVIFNNIDDEKKLIGVTNYGTMEWSEFNGAFYGCNNCAFSAPDIPDTVGVTDFQNAYRASSIVTPPLFDTSAATTVRNMLGSSDITSIPLYDLSSATNVRQFIASCDGLDGTALPTFALDLIDDAVSFMVNVAVTTASYNDLLVYMEANNVVTDTEFDGGDATHSGAGTTARAALIARTPGWTITDGGAA